MKRFILSIGILFFSISVFSQAYLACARKEKDWGYIDETGKWAINPQFEHVHGFSEGLAAVQNNGELEIVRKWLQ